MDFLKDILLWIKDAFIWLNDILLKMTWLQSLVDSLLINVFKIDESGYLFKALSFFMYDVVKIFILLSVLIYISSYIQAKFTPERTKKILSRFKGIKGNIIGALLGTVTPFCSCSSIPIFIGFTKAGLPVGVTFSFLISSPLVDLASVILLSSIFGWPIALAYVVVGLVIAVLGGTLIDKFKMERHIEDFVLQGVGNVDENAEIAIPSRKERHDYAIEQVKEVIKKVWIYILIGVGIGAVIHGYIPQNIIEAVLGENNPFSVLIATVVGVPMYADIFGTLPIAEALVLKGVGIGTVLAFMMAVTALSLPSIILLRKVVKPKLLGLFIFIVTLGIIITGYLFNIFGYLFI
ncbi:permease [Candidatus Izemoplasma sp. B36]|uniref:permease n=1 Tax=Candidatus Izemoplasma sp. B36 TaxID=3242468 RepID=UPI003556CF81